VPKVRSLLPVLIAFFAFQPYAMATDAPSASAPAATKVDEEEQVDEGLKRFGYGTTVVVETTDCAEVLKAYESRVEKFRASREVAQ